MCDSAAEYAMRDSITTGHVRMIEQKDFKKALAKLRPSTGLCARNVAMFANTDGQYDDLAAYLRRRRLL